MVLLLFELALSGNILGSRLSWRMAARRFSSEQKAVFSSEVWSHLFKHKVIITQLAAARFKIRHCKASIPIEMKNLFGFRDFKRISSNPINGVPPRRHAPMGDIVPPTFQRSSKE